MPIEKHISCSEVFWKSGDIVSAVSSAKAALCDNPSDEQRIALLMFIARAESKLGNFEASNEILRRLIDEQTYLPPVMLNLFYNSLLQKRHEKAKRNIDIVKLYIK